MLGVPSITQLTGLCPEFGDDTISSTTFEDDPDHNVAAKCNTGERISDER